MHRTPARHERHAKLAEQVDVSARRLLLLSNSRNPQGAFLEHVGHAVPALLDGVTRVLFVPFAGVTISLDDYTSLVRHAFAAWGVEVESVHDRRSMRRAVEGADAIVVGGGNTFRLLERLQHHRLLETIRAKALDGAPYIGWSAGSVLAGPTIGTTNDMPIVAPRGLSALGLVGFQINAHFTDAHPPGFRGETRRERLAEYLVLNPGARVVGLPEGSWLRVEGETITLEGPHDAPCFTSGRDTVLAAGSWVETEVRDKLPCDGDERG